MKSVIIKVNDYPVYHIIKSKSLKPFINNINDIKILYSINNAFITLLSLSFNKKTDWKTRSEMSKLNTCS